MLPRRLIAVVALLAAAGCSGEGGVIEEEIVRPGITAIDQSKALACEADRRALAQAIESYQLLEGADPANEATLVEAGFLREPSELWDLVAGNLVASTPDCGGVTTDIGEIVTSSGPPIDPAEALASFSPEQIERVGGAECARQLALIFAAGERFLAERATEPQSLDDFVVAGYLAAPITNWQLRDGRLVPVDGSGCIDPEAEVQP